MDREFPTQHAKDMTLDNHELHKEPLIELVQVDGPRVPH